MIITDLVFNSTLRVYTVLTTTITRFNSNVSGLSSSAGTGLSTQLLCYNAFDVSTSLLRLSILVPVCRNCPLSCVLSLLLHVDIAHTTYITDNDNLVVYAFP